MNYIDAVQTPVGAVVEAKHVSPSGIKTNRRGILLSPRPAKDKNGVSGVEIFFPNVGRRVVPLSRVGRVCSLPQLWAN